MDNRDVFSSGYSYETTLICPLALGHTIHDIFPVTSDVTFIYVFLKIQFDLLYPFIFLFFIFSTSDFVFILDRTFCSNFILLFSSKAKFLSVYTVVGFHSVSHSKTFLTFNNSGSPCFWTSQFSSPFSIATFPFITGLKFRESSDVISWT